VAGGGKWMGPFRSSTTALGISHAMYAATMAPMVLRNSSPASTASPNAHSRAAVNVRPSE
jgi:hypothetical protein